MFQNPLAKIADTQISRQRISRIPFGELCAFYAALRCDVRFPVIAAVSGLSLGAIGHLNAAGTHHGGQLRYPKVRAEYERLGHEAFCTEYLTPAMVERLVIAADQVKRQALAPPAFTGVNPRAVSHAGTHRKINKLNGNREQWFEIAWTESPPGWAWRDRWNSGENEKGAMWRGDPRHEERRFAKSKDAYDFYLLRAFPTQRQLDDGSCEAANDDSWFYSLPHDQKFSK